MTVSFYINRNDLQELYFLVDNFALVPFDKSTRDKAVSIECFNSFEEIKRKMDWKILPANNFIQVNVDYPKYEKIKEYLRF